MKSSHWRQGIARVKRFFSTFRQRTLPRRCRRLRFEAVEARNLLTGGLGHNPADPDDVNGDGIVTALDAMMTVNHLNNPDAAVMAHGFFDTDGNAHATPNDLIMVINRLNHPAQRRLDLMMPRSFDGSGNNLQHPDWGSAGIDLLRKVEHDYADGISAPSGAERKSPREISNLVAAQAAPQDNSQSMSNMLWQWGQFLDHDLDLTDPAEPGDSFPIRVPAGDPFFDPRNTGTQVIDFHRSQHNPLTGDSTANPRQQVNAITAFIDGSNVYGSDEQRAAALRTFSGGKLKTSQGDLLPFNEDGLPNGGGTGANLFLAGDVRANEQIGLTAMHTLWVREHNRLAEMIARQYPHFDDEHIFQKARAIVIAEMQAITYNEFLPMLLGADAMPPYTGYDPQVNPGIANVFSTAAYRFGHTMLPPELHRLNALGHESSAGHIALRDAFFNPSQITEHGIDSLIRGLARQPAQEIDHQIIDDVRNFLFGPPGAGGFDLASLNMQRGRDHGLPDYNQVRAAYGLAPVTSFAEITSDVQLQAKLAAAYDTVNDIDVWMGALSEDHAPGANVGELIRAVLVDQFDRLRAGDRYWYQNTMAGGRLAQIERTTLADVIRHNTGVVDIQPNAFVVPSGFVLSSAVDGTWVIETTNKEDFVEQLTQAVQAGFFDDLEVVAWFAAKPEQDRLTKALESFAQSPAWSDDLETLLEEFLGSLGKV